MSGISVLDEINLRKIRENVSHFIARCAKTYDRQGAFVLDIAPQDHEGATPYFEQATVELLDIDDSSGARYVADLCADNSDLVPSNHFDYVVCTEVLEHTRQPFSAVREIERVLKPGGCVFVSTPFNLRIHGPLPDCWRFTEHGLRELFSSLEIVELNALDSEDRFLMPIHYTLIAKKR